MGTAEVTDREALETEPRGLDGLMRRYSRWRRERLVTLAEVPLSTLTLQSLYLSVCVLADGILLPWLASVLDGGFSWLLFVVLLVPALAAESVLYRRMKARRQKPA
jgi:hypothetical protein